MSHALRSFLILAFGGLFVLHAFSADKSRQTLKGWGEVIDPDGDCRVSLEGSKVTIAIPATKHDLSVEVGDVNSPRVLSDIEGDFIAQVKVAGNVRHTGKRTSDQFRAYHGGGLLLWQDGRTYIRLERAAITDEEGVVTHYANFELRKEGKRIESESTGMRIPDDDTYLRLERRGGRITGSISRDGIQWHPFDPLTVELTRKLKLGIGAINTSTEPFKAEFSELEIFKKEKE